MHMADSLLSPAVGTMMWGTAAGLVAYSVKKVKRENDDSKVPLMGVLGAFVFAAQMINFSIPGTGSSGHLGGGLLLAVLLGPYRAFLTMLSILALQALFFADGGLLALGCNVFNLAFFPSFIAYPYIYKPLAGDSPTKSKLMLAAGLAAVIGLQLGALGVVLETQLSGISELPFTAFLLLMQPIHLAIGIVEGMVTAATLVFLLSARPDILRSQESVAVSTTSLRGLIVGILTISLIVGGILSWFASSDPDGLEWSVMKAAGQDELVVPAGIHSVLAELQDKLAIMPDYNFRAGETAGTGEGKTSDWPAVDGGQSVAGIVGVIATMLIAGAIGKLLQSAAKRC